MAGTGGEPELFGGGPRVGDEPARKAGSTQARATSFVPFSGPMSCSKRATMASMSVGLDEAALDQQRLERLGAERVPARDRVVVVRVVVVIVVIVVVVVSLMRRLQVGLEEIDV